VKAGRRVEKTRDGSKRGETLRESVLNQYCPVCLIVRSRWNKPEGGHHPILKGGRARMLYAASHGLTNVEESHNPGQVRSDSSGSTNLTGGDKGYLTTGSKLLSCETLRDCVRTGLEDDGPGVGSFLTITSESPVHSLVVTVSRGHFLRLPQDLAHQGLSGYPCAF
jgi:hypothetical protein